DVLCVARLHTADVDAGHLGRVRVGGRLAGVERVLAARVAEGEGRHRDKGAVHHALGSDDVVRIAHDLRGAVVRVSQLVDGEVVSGEGAVGRPGDGEGVVDRGGLETGADLVLGAWVCAGREVAAGTGLAIRADLLVPEGRL